MIATPVTGDSDADAAAREGGGRPPSRREPRRSRRRQATAAGGGAGSRRTWLARGRRDRCRRAAGRGSRSTPSRATRTRARAPTTGTTAARPADHDATRPVAKGLAGVVQKDVWDKCAVSSTPQPGAVESAICLPAANGTVFFLTASTSPSTPTQRRRRRRSTALRASDPHSAALVAGKGNCNSLSWNGFGIWRHALDKSWAGTLLLRRRQAQYGHRVDARSARHAEPPRLHRRGPRRRAR